MQRFASLYKLFVNVHVFVEKKKPKENILRFLVYKTDTWLRIEIIMKLKHFKTTVDYACGICDTGFSFLRCSLVQQ